jgi:DNA invertase Pin-like site-specific DNA recombinase
MRYAAYVRVSSEEQSLGFSLDAQEQLLREWVRGRHGASAGELVDVYRDEGFSARKDDRPAFQRMIADARTGRFDAVVVHKFDRLARDRYDAMAYKTLLRKDLGLQVFSSSEPSEDSGSPEGVLVEGILEVTAHWYSLNLAAETRKGKRQKAEAGLWHGATPTGYCNGSCLQCKDPNGPDYCPFAGQPDRGDGKVLIPHPVESHAIRLAFRRYSSGELSDRDVAHELNTAIHKTADGQEVRFRTKFYRRKGSQSGPGAFTKDTVKDILTRPFYAGIVEYYGADPRTGKRRRSPLIVRQGRHEPLVPLELFQQCQDVRRSRGKAASGRKLKRQTSVYPLAGILICDECGARMRSHRNGGTRYYRCRTRIQRKDCCSQPTVRAKVVEAAVDSLIGSLILPTDLRERIQAYLVRHESLEAVEVKQRALRSQFQRAKELYLAGDIDRDRYDREKAEFKQAMDRLAFGRPSDTGAVHPLLDDFAALWAATMPLERKGLLATVFREIRVQDGQIVGFHAASPFDELLCLMKD